MRVEHPCPRCGRSEVEREPRTPPTWRCECGHRWQAEPLGFLPGDASDDEIAAFAATIMDRLSPGPRCPKCSSAEVIPIEYGMPGIELAEAAERGEVVLGGCVVLGDDPTHECGECGHRFTSHDPPATH